jgi:hypothetical protein
MPRPRKKTAAKPTRTRKTAAKKTAPPPKPQPPAPLTADDVEQLFRLVVPEWRLDRLDTRLGTQTVAQLLKAGGDGAHGGVTAVPEGLPYASRDRADWWSWHYDRVPQGFDVKVEHDHRDRDPEVLRQGRVSWSRLANMATLKALMRRDPRPGEQTVMPL